MINKCYFVGILIRLAVLSVVGVFARQPLRFASVVVLVLITVLSTGCSDRLPNRVVVRNSAGTEISGITLVLDQVGGEKSLEESVSNLRPAEKLTLRHDMNDLSVNLRYTVGETAHEHCEEYVDLWSGETWLLDIRPDGTVRAGYESPRFEQWFATMFAVAMIAIGIFLACFYGVYIKRKEVGPGIDTPEKRIALYTAIGIGVMFIGGGMVFLVFRL